MNRYAAAVLAIAGWALFGIPGAAAQTYYVDLRGGYSVVHDAGPESGGVAAPATTFGYGPAAAIGSGMQWVDGWRFEGELSWRRSDFDTAGGVPTSGAIEARAAMFNIAYRIQHERSVTPYFGIGIGAAQVLVSDLPVGAATVNDSDVTAAWQAMAGVDFAVSQFGVLSLEYRYLSAGEPELTDSTGTAYSMHYRNSSMMVGYRWGF